MSPDHVHIAAKKLLSRNNSVQRKSMYFTTSTLESPLFGHSNDTHDQNKSEIDEDVDESNMDDFDDYLDGLTLEEYTTNLDLSKNNRY
ncbi:hypothetical protein BB559_003103 [Furculomyces boomerangus]|uniref:Uncharacterized protein n=1 Tax=Furculomyces boomerangus TaxID=61424 RepID=A0A2T9YP42_9FUNG|nr:hypothetical protein BB559_003103 [Furculomyces boomerangus]